MEHCRRKPLHSSATPVKGAGRAMGLAIIGGEEVVMVDTEVVDVVAGIMLNHTVCGSDLLLR